MTQAFLQWISGLIGVSSKSIVQLLFILWLVGPFVMIVQAGVGLWRRGKLLRNAVAVDAEVNEIYPSGITANDLPTIVDMRVTYDHDGKSFEHWVVRSGPEAATFGIGNGVKLLYEKQNPPNVIDAAKRPWDDVTGPMVFAVLLFIFMFWLFLVLVGWP